MTPARALLDSLTAAGFTVRAAGEKLRFCPATMPADLLEQVRARKAELLALLASPAAAAVAEPEPDRAELLGDWILHHVNGVAVLCHPDRPPDPSDRWWEPAGQRPPRREPVAGRCRCGSTEFVDVPIHGGQSIRRDCRRCGQFHSFPKWYGQPTAAVATDPHKHEDYQ